MRTLPLKRSARDARSRKGVAAVEFALTVGFLLAVLLGIVELSLLMSRLYTVSRAGRDACRIGTGQLEGVDANGDVIEAEAVKHAVFALNAALNDICGPWDYSDASSLPPVSPPCYVEALWFQDDSGWMMLKVDVAVDYTPFTGLLPLLPDQTASTFTMLTQQQDFS